MQTGDLRTLGKIPVLKIKVDTAICSGHARCAAVAPDVYWLDDNGYCAADGHPVAAGSEDLARRGARACPERAITLVEMQDGRADQGTGSASVENPRDVALGFFADVSAGRFSQAWDRLAPDLNYEIVAPAPGGGRVDKTGLGRAAAYVTQRLAEPLNLQVRGVTSEGERVAIEVESMARTKAGTIYNNHYHFLFIVRGGKIVEGREYLDSAHYLELISQ